MLSSRAFKSSFDSDSARVIVMRGLTGIGRTNSKDLLSLAEARGDFGLIPFLGVCS